MTSLFQPLFELINGEAYCPHPADAALSLGRRFQERVIVIIGGGGTGIGWTQRVRFDRAGSPTYDRSRSAGFKRGTPEWREHLVREAQTDADWAVLLIEQQWQAAASGVSAASSGTAGVEQMLRVREARADFGDDRISDDAVRVAIDHPTMEGAVVAGVRAPILDALEREAEGAGFRIAAVRIATIALLERHIARLEKERESPSRSLVIYDGQSALLVGVRDGAFDFSEGALSYLVNRAGPEVRSQLLKRIGSPLCLREWGGRIDLIGSDLSLGDYPPIEGLDLRHEAADPVLAAVDEQVRHDLRSNLQEMRTALPRWSRKAFHGVAILIAICVGISSLQAVHALQLEEKILASQLEEARYRAAISSAKARMLEMKQEEAAIRQTGEWVDRNYHAQALVQSFLSALPVEVALDAVSIQATEGLPQAKLKFTLFGSEDAQRAGLRSVEARLYQLGYEIGRREDPLPASSHRGGVVYAWDLILPTFGA